MKIKTLALAAGMAAAVFSQAAHALTLEEFQARMQQLVKRIPSKDSVSLEMQVLGRGTSIFSHEASKGLITASVMKLITTQVALDRAGPAYTFETTVSVDGKRSGGDVEGNLVLQGNGDPYLVSERLWLLARDVARSGIKKVSGGIKVNNSNFTEDYKGLVEWQDTGEPFTAFVSATSFNFNSVEVHVVAEKGAKTPRVEAGPLPNAYVELRNQVSFVPGTKKSLSIKQQSTAEGKEIFVISGTMGRDASPAVLYATVSNPAAYIANVFAALLRNEGIQVNKDFAGISTKTIAKENVVASQESLALNDLTRLYDTYSNNFMAEQVFQMVGVLDRGYPTSLAKSRQAVLDYLHPIESCKNIEIDNGSGLSWKTRVSARCFADMIQNSYREFRVFSDLIGSMPIGGTTGTLRNRFKNAGSDFDPVKVRAKTGTLWSEKAVTSLVGFTQTASGETVVFAILQNDERGGSDLLQGMRDWEDACVELIQQLKL